MLTCDACGAQFPYIDDVLDLGEDAEARSVSLERKGVYRTEHNPELGGINDAFDDLSQAEGGLKDAILALPHGDDSRYTTKPATSTTYAGRGPRSISWFAIWTPGRASACSTSAPT